MKKEEEEMRECHCLQTVEALMRVGIGRSERIEAMRSELRVVKSDIAEMETTTQRREEMG